MERSSVLRLLLIGAFALFIFILGPKLGLWGGDAKVQHVPDEKY